MAGLRSSLSFGKAIPYCSPVGMVWDDYERAVAGLGPIGGDREVVYDRIDLTVFERREGVRDGVEGPDLADLTVFLELVRLRGAGGAELDPTVALERSPVDFIFEPFCTRSDWSALK